MGSIGMLASPFWLLVGSDVPTAGRCPASSSSRGGGRWLYASHASPRGGGSSVVWLLWPAALSAAYIPAAAAPPVTAAPAAKVAASVIGPVTFLLALCTAVSAFRCGFSSFHRTAEKMAQMMIRSAPGSLTSGLMTAPT